MSDDELIDAAAAVADGERVNWTRSGSDRPARADASSFEQLHIISQIAEVHRQVAVGASFAAVTESASSGPASAADEGSRWGKLKVLEKLGSGSFGDVYRAWDQSLDRQVALKLLRRGRGGSETVTEGQMLARIGHPNVMAIYGAAEVDGQIGIWGEFLRGRTLASMVETDGPLGAPEVLIIADAICRALAAVHRAGLLHRDVKAQNVIRETGGRIVLMDFGLGRPMDSDGAAEPAGTPLYLAPELFSTGRASVKSDLYAVGVLLFYLSSGTYPVMASSVDGITSAHKAGRRQKLQDLRPELPTSFVQLVERALAIDPDQRFESAGAMLQAIAAAGHSSHGPALSAARPSLWVAAIWSVMAAAAAAAIVAVVLWPESPTEPAPRLVSIEPPPGTRFSDSTRNVPALSPDGSWLAFSATDDKTGKIHLWIHSLENATSKLVSDSERALTPFWAPDGQRLAFFEPGGTITWATRDGIHQGSIATGSEPRGAAWNAEGLILYPKGPRSGLYALSTADPAAGERLIIDLDRARGELGYTWPQFLEDGRRFVYFVLSNDPNVRGIYVASLDGRSRVRLVASNASGVVAGSSLLFVKEGNLVLQPLSPDRMRADGAATTIAENVAVSYDSRSAVTAAREGSIAYLPGREDTELVWISRSGTALGRLDIPPARYRSPALSRDGSFVAVERYRDGLSEIQVFETASGRPRPALAHSANVQFPVWGPGAKLAYTSIDQGEAAIYVKDFASDAPPVVVLASDGDRAATDVMPTDWSPDGRHLVFVNFSPDRPYGLWALPLGPDGRAFAIRPGEGTQVAGHISPDGSTLVYGRRALPTRSGEPPDRELWACDFPSGANPRLLASGGIDPAWPSNGWVSYLDRAGALTIIPAVRPRIPVALTSFRPGVNTPEASRNNYAWATGGERLIVNRPLHDPAGLRVMVRFRQQ